MAFTNRYSDTIRGALTFTGNTAGLSKIAGQNNQGTLGNIGAFTSLNNGLVVGNFPAGTTLNIVDNGSSANLVIPTGSTIVYAELIWGGNYFGQDGNTGQQVNISGLINNPVQLTTSLGTNSINPDPATAENQTQVSNSGTPFDFIASFYSRSQNITNLIAPLGAGTHTISVEEIPGLTEPIDNITQQTNHAGWTLAVAYENPSLPYRNLNIFVGGELVRDGEPPVDITVSGFTTPSAGTIEARLLLSAQEGDANVPGDSVEFGPTLGTLSPISGPNNPVDNFFGSQINDDSGNLDTSGTFGTRNQDPFTLTNIPGGRQGWDITNVDASSTITNNQTSAALRLSTVGDTYMPNTIGIQIDVESPTIAIDKSVDKLEGIKGDRLLYTLVITNTGNIATNNFNLIDVAPTGTTIDTGTINIINATGPVVDNSTPSTIDLELGAVSVGQVVTVQYEVITDNNTPTPVDNNAQATFEFTPGIGQPPILDNAESNTVRTELALVTQSKAVSDAEVLVGDIITYTVTIDNTQSAVAIDNVFVYDPLQAGTSYVPSSTVIGLNPPIDANPSVLPGVSVVTVPAGQTLTVSFDVRVDTLPSPNPILNTASISFTVGTSNTTQNTNETEVLVLEPDITAVKSVDKALAQVGDTLTYTTIITNTGNVPLQNIIFNDPPPANTTFIPNTVIIDGNPYAGVTPTVPIDFLAVPVFPNIFPLAPGSFVDISYQVTIDSLSIPPEINNIATVDYEVLVDNDPRRLSENSNEVTTDIFVINIVKTVDKVAAEGGDTLTYTSTITSTIPGNYGSPIVFRDLVPAETTLVPASISVVGSTFTNNSTPTEVILDFGNTFPPNPIVVTFDVLIDNDAAGPILNESQVDIRTETTTSNETQTNIVDPSVSKSVSQSSALVGDVITYTVTIDNSTGQAPITNVFVYDNLQPGTSYVNGSTVIGLNPPINSDPTILPGIPVGVIPAGQIQTVSFDVRIDVFPTPNPILNTADVSYEVDGESKTQTTNETQVLVQSPDINIVKSADKDFAQVGETVTYTSVITNTGTVNIDNIIFNDLPPLNTVYDGNGVTIQGTNYLALDPNNPIDLATVNPGLFPLVPGASITISYSVIITSLPAPPQVQNISSTDYLFTVNNIQESRTENSNTVTTQIYELDILKEVDKIAAEGGDILTYTFTITSNISGNIGVPINFIDNIPAETTLVPGSINVVGIPTFTDNSVPGQVNLDLGDNLILNPIVVSFDVLVDNNAVGPILDISQLDINGITTPSNEVRTDIANLIVIKEVSVLEAEVGEVITYTVTIDNSQSNISVDNVFVFDQLQSGTSYVPGSTVINGNLPINSDPSLAPGINVGTVPAGAIIPVTFDVRIDAFPNPNPVLNTADVNYEVDGESKTQTTNETQVLVQQPDIEVTKSVDKAFAKLGDTLIYTVVTENTGTVDLQNLIFTDPPPANTVYDGLGVTINGTLYPALDPNVPIDIGVVNPALFPVPQGGTITVSFGVIITNVPTPPTITNTSTIDYFYLINGGNRQREESNTVQTEIFDLNIEKSVEPISAERGDTVTFTSTITSNISGNIGADIIFRDTIPAGTTLVPGSIDVSGILSFTDNSTPTEIILDLGTVIPANPIVVTFDITIDNDASGTILNTSSVETNNVPVDSNEVEVDIVILEVNKTSSVSEAEVGEVITYTVTIDNSQSSAPIENVFLYDALQTGTSYVANSTVIGLNPPINANPSILPGVSIGTIDAGEVLLVSFDVRIDSIPTPNPALNTANINYKVDGEPKTKITNETQVLVFDPSVRLVKEVSNEFVQVGETLVYTSTITNTGTIDLESILFTDLPPANTAYDGLGVTINGTLYPALNPNVPIDIGAVNPALLPLSPGGSIEVLFGVIVNSVPIPPQIVNTSKITYSYIIDGETKSKTENSNEVISRVIDLDLIKSVNPQIAERLDIVTFTTTITSNVSGNINSPIIFKDILPLGTELISTSVNVVGVVGFTDLSTQNEVVVNLGTTLPPNPIVVSFDARILNTAQSPINNTSLVDIKDKETESNEVTLDLVILQASKSVNDDVVAVGETITYSILLDNTLSTADATNVFLLDLLQPEVSYVANSTSINGGALQNLDPSIPPGINIGTVPAKSATLVTFNVLVNKLPSQNPILNTATITYNAGEKENVKTTNETQVKVVDIDIIKSVDPEFAQVGDTITYTSVITNTGQVPIENIIFNDPPPSNTIYNNPSFKINNMLYPTLNPSLPIDLSLVVPSLLPLNPGESITIEFSVSVNTLPDIPIIDNTSSIEYSYLDGSILKTNNKESNLVDTIIREGKITLEKIADKEVALVGDTLTYTINVKNTGNIEVENVILTDIVPKDTKFVEGSVIVNGSPDSNLNPEKGINLGTIQAPLTNVVSFKVTIESLPLSGQIINNALASYEVFVNPDGPPVIENTTSNDVITKVELLSVSISKSCNPNCVSIGEEVNYVFNIVNNGTVDALNVKLFDEIPAETSFVEGSFIGAQGIVTAKDLIEGVDIGDVDAGKGKEISFKVKIDKVICGSNIVNKASITYEYTLDDGKTYKTSSSTSNECDVTIKATSFKQTFIDTILQVPDVKPDIENIIDVDAKFICTNTKIIDTPVGTSHEGQNLTGKKLVINGKLCITVTYVAEVETQTVHTAHFEICVCEYIVIPNGTNLDCNINPSVYIEDIFFEKINCRQLFTNIVFMIESGI